MTILTISFILLQLALESNMVSQLNSPVVELTLSTDRGEDCQIEMDCNGIDKLISNIHQALEAASSSTNPLDYH